MMARHLQTYVVSVRRRADRRARMERVLPAAWDVQFTSDWDGPMDRHSAGPGDLPGFGLCPWEVPGGDLWRSRPLKLGEAGRAMSHWTCWQQAAADGAGPALILEDDAVLAGHFAARLQSLLTRLWMTDPNWDLLYLGRGAIDGEDRPVTKGIVRPGIRYRTGGYLLSACGLHKVLGCGFERGLIPVGEFFPARYLNHPREDIRLAYPERLSAYAPESALITQLPEEEAESGPEANAFVVTKNASDERDRRVSQAQDLEWP